MYLSISVLKNIVVACFTGCRSCRFVEEVKKKQYCTLVSRKYIEKYHIFHMGQSLPHQESNLFVT